MLLLPRRLFTNSFTNIIIKFWNGIQTRDNEDRHDSIYENTHLRQCVFVDISPPQFHSIKYITMYRQAVNIVRYEHLECILLCTLRSGVATKIIHFPVPYKSSFFFLVLFPIYLHKD